MTDQQSVHQCDDPDCRVESVRKLRWQIEDLTIAIADAMAWPDDLVLPANVRALLNLRDVLQELDVRRSPDATRSTQHHDAVVVSSGRHHSARIPRVHSVAVLCENPVTRAT
ncbi:MAG: hypothetical protein GC157_06100 [Frankiales bacterium]|nr:hypothetical protein [Frankiales bacterium]